MTYTHLRPLLFAVLIATSWGFGSIASAQTAGGDTERPPTDDERPGERRETSHDALLDVEPEAPVMPARILGTLGGGTSYRFILDPNFAQKRFAPGYLELSGAYVFAGSGVYRHGVSLALSTNVTGDGNPSIGVDGFQQWTLIPSYLAYFRFSDDWILAARGGIALTNSFNVQGDKAFGFELSAALTYMITAGAGLFVHVATDLFFGTSWSTHPMASIGGGLVVDYEVLP